MNRDMPSEAAAGPNPAIDQALESLYLLGMAYRKLMTHAPAREGVVHPAKQFSPLSLGIIFLLNQLGPQSPSQLADHLVIARPNLTPMLADLRRQGIVELYPDPNDKRKQRAMLSEKGLSIANAIHDFHQTTFRELLSKLDPKDLDSLGTAARTLNEILSRFF